MIKKNKKAYFDYFILEEYDAGIILKGSEVKSIRLGNISFNDAFIFIKDNEVWLKNFKVARYKQAHIGEPHEDNRDKKLLLTKIQIKRIRRDLQDKGITCIPLGVFVKHNKIKIKIGIAKGKKNYDKRNSIREKDNKKELKKLSRIY
jgi:SsrA-binding protein